MEQNSESSIIQRARQGDQDAISRLYNETKNYAYFVARRYMQIDEDIADVLQDSYISVFSKLDTFEDGKPFKPWLHSIVTNKCLNFIKSRRAVFVSVDDIAELAGVDEELIPVAWLERAEKRRDIIRIIDGLPEGQRMAVTLFYFEGLSISEMAEIMGVAEGTIKAHLYYGRKNIKEEVLREEKKGNKLYAIVPLPLLTQLFELEAETAVMPESMSQKVWEGTLQQLVSNGVVAGAGASTASVVAAGAAKTGMTLATKIIIGVVAAAVVAAGAIFLPPLLNSPDNTTPPGVTETPSGMESPFDKGTYEGEYDADGKRSGYGVWVYDNFRYEGYWENDMPNGEGTLYEASTPPANRESGQTYTTHIVVQGNWVDGFGDGTILLTWYLEDGANYTWRFNVVNGYTTKDEDVYTENGLINLTIEANQLYAGVPPWADVKTNSAVDAPGGNEQPDGWDETSGEGKADKPSYVTANINGNTTSNLNNRGLVAVQGDWIYFSSNDGNDEDQSKYPATIRVCGYLYAVKTDGSGLRKLADDKASYINVVGDWVYYYNENQGELYKVKIDGTERQRVASYAQNLYVVGDWMYSTNFRLYAINLNKNEQYHNAEQNMLLELDSATEGWIEEITASGDWIYYTCSINKSLYKVKNDGTGKEMLTADNCREIQVVGDEVYYIGDSSYLHAIKTDGTGKRSVMGEDLDSRPDARPHCYNVTEDIIYFVNMDDDYKLYCIKPDGSNLTKLNDETCLYLNVVGDWIYFVNGEDFKIYKMKTDGTERYIMQ